MMLCVTQNCGHKSRPARVITGKTRRVKTVVLPHNRPSVAKTVSNREVSMSGTSTTVNIQPTHRCSFCGVTNVESEGAFIAGPGVSICQKCVFQCVEIIFNQAAKTNKPTS